jgi:hypothetical protein
VVPQKVDQLRKPILLVFRVLLIQEGVVVEFNVLAGPGEQVGG